MERRFGSKLSEKVQLFADARAHRKLLLKDPLVSPLESKGMNGYFCGIHNGVPFFRDHSQLVYAEKNRSPTPSFAFVSIGIGDYDECLMAAGGKKSAIFLNNGLFDNPASSVSMDGRNCFWHDWKNPMDLPKPVDYEHSPAFPSRFELFPPAWVSQKLVLASKIQPMLLEYLDHLKTFLAKLPKIVLRGPGYGPDTPSWGANFDSRLAEIVNTAILTVQNAEIGKERGILKEEFQKRKVVPYGPDTVLKTCESTCDWKAELLAFKKLASVFGSSSIPSVLELAKNDNGMIMEDLRFGGKLFIEFDGNIGNFRKLLGTRLNREELLQLFERILEYFSDSGTMAGNSAKTFALQVDKTTNEGRIVFMDLDHVLSKINS